ncbi:MAG: hypothetical protein US76_02420 [Parcubacteria group bacterium GW2011_GWA2_38_13b]|nr:MAG: hypothetical protein US76_02420 [Parcubacteria group bacterium GW2011_GWA2_38_13b]
MADTIINERKRITRISRIMYKKTKEPTISSTFNMATVEMSIVCRFENIIWEQLTLIIFK